MNVSLVTGMLFLSHLLHSGAQASVAVSWPSSSDAILDVDGTNAPSTWMAQLVVTHSPCVFQPRRLAHFLEAFNLARTIRIHSP